MQTKVNCNGGDWDHFFVIFRDKGMNIKVNSLHSILTEAPIWQQRRHGCLMGPTCALKDEITFRFYLLP